MNNHLCRILLLLLYTTLCVLDVYSHTHSAAGPSVIFCMLACVPLFHTTHNSTRNSVEDQAVSIAQKIRRAQRCYNKQENTQVSVGPSIELKLSITMRSKEPAQCKVHIL
jgi:hypothetical protein